MRIAIVGAGIAGNVAAYHLSRAHEVTVFEAGDHVLSRSLFHRSPPRWSRIVTAVSAVRRCHNVSRAGGGLYRASTAM